MGEPTFGHQPMTRDEARAEYLRMLAKMDGVEVPRVLVQPDDPGPYARTCLRCGFDEGLGAMRLCARCCPPAPFWPLWIGPALMFALGQEVRRVIGRALDGIDSMGATRSAKKRAEEAGKPRTF